MLTLDPDNFVCPTCHRPLDPDDMEAKQEQMTAEFNRGKAARIAENNSRGKQNKAVMEQLSGKILMVKAAMEQARNEIAGIKASEAYNMTEEKPDVDKAIRESEQWQQIAAAVEQAAARIDNTTAETEDTTRLEAERKSIQAEIDAPQALIANRDTIARHNGRIAELEGEYRAGQQQIADIERTEYVMAAFNKARTNEVDKRINGMFSLVPFRIFEHR